MTCTGAWIWAAVGIIVVILLLPAVTDGSAVLRRVRGWTESEIPTALNTTNSILDKVNSVQQQELDGMKAQAFAVLSQASQVDFATLAKYAGGMLHSTDDTLQGWLQDGKITINLPVSRPLTHSSENV